MSDRNIRHPFRNFFIKRSIQSKIIVEICLTVLLTAVFTIGFLTLLYNLKAREGSFYYMSNDIMQDLELKSILGIILPPLLIAETIAIAIAFGIGLFSSRKIAVPLYKMERWAANLRFGKLNTKLAFREEDDLKELAIQCNGVCDFYKDIFTEIKNASETIQKSPADSATIEEQSKIITQCLRKVEM